MIIEIILGREGSVSRFPYLNIYTKYKLQTCETHTYCYSCIFSKSLLTNAFSWLSSVISSAVCYVLLKDLLLKKSSSL